MAHTLARPKVRISQPLYNKMIVIHPYFCYDLICLFVHFASILSLDQHIAYKAGARSEVGPSRLPVTEKIAGSNPVGPASRNLNATRQSGFLISSLLGFEPDENRRFGGRGTEAKSVFTRFSRVPQGG